MYIVKEILKYDDKKATFLYLANFAYYEFYNKVKIFNVFSAIFFFYLYVLFYPTIIKKQH